MSDMIQAIKYDGNTITAHKSNLFRLSTKASVRDIISLETGEVLYAADHFGKAWYSNEAIAMIYGE